MTETIQQIREAWKEASQQIHDAPDQFKAHYPNLSPSQLDESIETFCKWAEKGNAPHGFKPVSSLARTMLAVEAGKLLNAIKQFNDSQDWVFPFLEPLGRALSFVSLAAVFSDKDDARQLVAEHGGKLAESLTLMDTAQAELGRKMESLKEADAAIERIKDHEITIAAKAKASEQSEQTIAESKEATSQHLEEIEATKDEIEELKTQVQTALQEAETLRKSNDSFQAKLKEQSDQLEALKAKAEIQAKTVAELLPNATSAGLASSYGDRARSFLPAMKLWRTLFMAAIAMLIVASWILVGYTIKQDTDTWHYLLLRLPVALPIVWLAWFSAIQYGNAMRLEEHYSFKEATSKAFAGYREHIQQLGGVTEGEDDGENPSQNIVKQLASTTVQILAKPPADIFSGPEKEASPLSQMLAVLVARIVGGKGANPD
jgi:hypothetical protein